MNHTTRSTRAAVLAASLLATVATAVPAHAEDTTEHAATQHAGTQRAGTGALTARTLSARAVLTSTSGKKLVLTIGASPTAKGSTVTLGLARGSESHLWTYRARASDLVIGSTGGGTLHLSEAQTGQRGHLDLRFSPKDTVRTRTCGGQVASRTRPMAVSGVAFVKSGTKPWGTVGKATRGISLGAGSLTWTYDVDCPSPAPTCRTGLSWSGFTSTASGVTGVSGSSSGSSASITAYRSQTLAAPAGATRMDLVTRTAPVPSFTTSGSSATLTAALGTGRLTVHGDGGFGDTHTCRDGSTTRTATDTSWFGSVTNDTTALRVPAEVFGGFGLPDGATASIGRQTF